MRLAEKQAAQAINAKITVVITVGVMQMTPSVMVRNLVCQLEKLDKMDNGF